jgi:hypothetical protein
MNAAHRAFHRIQSTGRFAKSMKIIDTRERWLVWLNLLFAGLASAGFLSCYYVAHRAAEEAVRRYGHNVDSGALVALVGWFFFLPAALLSALAAIAFWRGWWLRWLIEAAALAWCFLPVIFLVRGLFVPHGV